MKNLRLIGLLSICSFVGFGSSSSSYANDDASSSFSQTSFSGFYSGLDIGGDYMKGKFRDKLNDKDVSKRKFGLDTDLFAGYNFQIEKLILGLEAEVGMGFSKVKKSLNNNDVSIKRNYSFGFSPKIGYEVFSGFAAYFLTGMDYSKFKMKTLDSLSKKKGKSIIRVALGVEKNFDSSLFVRAEVGKGFSKKILDDNNVKINSNSLRVKIGGGYRF